MTIRNTTILAIAFAASVVPFAPACAQQYELPDSAAWLLPADPGEFVRLVEERKRSAGHLFEAGCPGDGGWAGAAFRALEEAAAEQRHLSDLHIGYVRFSFAQSMGTELASATGRIRGIMNPTEAQCPADLPLFESWLAAELRHEWESGRLAGMNQIGKELIHELQSAKSPETYALLREIALDSGVYNESDGGFVDGWNWDQRGDAAYAMVSYRQRELGEDRLDALQAVLFELAATPNFNFEGMARETLSNARGEAFRQEYEEVLKAVGRGSAAPRHFPPSSL